jgi:hypothetical protein
MDNNLEDKAEQSLSYTNLLFDIFKGLDADPAEALTATITASAVIARGIGVPKDTLISIFNDTVEDVYALDAVN